MLPKLAGRVARTMGHEVTWIPCMSSLQIFKSLSGDELYRYYRLISKIQKYFLYCSLQTKTLQPYLLLFIIALHITLVCIFSRQPRAISNFLAPLHLHIYLFCIAYLLSVLYTYTHLVLDNHLVRLRAQSNFILPCRLLEEGQEGSLYTQFPGSSI
jgi:hypothetical protein